MYDMDFTLFSHMCTMNKGRCPHSLGTINNACYHETKERKCFDVREKRRQWSRLRTKVFNRDGRRCRLYRLLNDYEKHLIENDFFGMNRKLDPAHVFGRGSHPHMSYELDNVVTLSRLFHTRLDQYKNPITGESITLEDTYKWWERIVGDGWEELKNKAEKA